jgi:hypothetical protein
MIDKETEGRVLDSRHAEELSFNMGGSPEPPPTLTHAARSSTVLPSGRSFAFILVICSSDPQQWFKSVQEHTCTPACPRMAPFCLSFSAYSGEQSAHAHVYLRSCDCGYICKFLLSAVYFIMVGWLASIANLCVTDGTVCESPWRCKPSFDHEQRVPHGSVV